MENRWAIIAFFRLLSTHPNQLSRLIAGKGKMDPSGKYVQYSEKALPLQFSVEHLLSATHFWMRLGWIRKKLQLNSIFTNSEVGKKKFYSKMSVLLQPGNLSVSSCLKIGTKKTASTLHMYVIFFIYFCAQCL
jgi:hypothetical protein